MDDLEECGKEEKKSLKSGEKGKERDDEVKKKQFEVINQQSSLLKVKRVEVQCCHHHREIEAKINII